MVATSKYFLSRYFEKYLHGMVLRLSGHVRKTISLLCKQKTEWNFDIWNFFSKKKKWFFFSILVYFHWNSAFWVRSCLKTSLWRHTLTEFMILVPMERGDPTLYHGTKQSYFGNRQFQVHEGVVTTPLSKPRYKKRLGRTRVK